jgi:hypothetical protein
MSTSNASLATHQRVMAISLGGLSRGNSSSLEISPDGTTIIKSPSSGHEFYLRQIQAEGVALRELSPTGVVPKLISASGDSIQMERIRESVTLMDYMRAASAGMVSPQRLEHLMFLAAVAVFKTAERGFYHADSHPDNFLVTLRGGEMVVLLIDWGRVFTPPEVTERLGSGWAILQRQLRGDRPVTAAPPPASVKEAIELASSLIRASLEAHIFWDTNAQMREAISNATLAFEEAVLMAPLPT